MIFGKDKAVFLYRRLLPVITAAMLLTACGSDTGSEIIEDGITRITCQDNSVHVSGPGVKAGDKLLTITQAGVYELSGSYEGQLAVDAGKEDEVRIILNEMQLTGTDSAALNGIQSRKIVITLAEGTQNRISDASQYYYEDAGEDEPDAAIFSKDDITIQGTGSLEVTGNYKDGIRSKDGLVIMSGDIAVNAREDAVSGKDSVTIQGGAFHITAGKDGIKANEDEDEEKGYVTVEDCDIVMNAGDDGIHAETALLIEDGTIDILSSREGLEGMTVTVNGGNIHVKSSNDGINAAGAKSDDSIAIYINGGYLYVNADGDGIDSNGNIYVTGGTLLVEGPEDDQNAGIDYDGTAVITGGIVIASGSAGMAQGFGEDSEQGALLLDLGGTQQAGTLLCLTDSRDNMLLGFRPSKAYASMVISTPDLKLGENYRIFLGGEVQGEGTDGYYADGSFTDGTQAAELLLDQIVLAKNLKGEK